MKALLLDVAWPIDDHDCMFSILHITDLHRAKNDPISNAELLSALISDMESYEREVPPIRRPDAIIVSGDIIQGVGLGEPDHEKELERQYEAADEFLAALTDHFLSGDRSRIVIVPGNHDIDWNVARAAMTPTDDNEHRLRLPAALHEFDSKYRWDWKSRQLFEISDPAAYERRFAPFWSFFENFYKNVEGLLRVDPWSDANLFSLDEGRIAVAAFNSCASNDCFAFHGEISREVIAKAHLDLKQFGSWFLRIAVWHHDIEGPPHRSDYMDPDIVRGMIGRGYRLGLYGHQHRTQVTPQHAYLPDRETMAIASAGSLCAGSRELPTGALRGYSIVEINESYSGARVHVREMAVANLFSRAHLSSFGGRSFVDLEWTVPKDTAGRPEDPAAERKSVRIAQAEAALYSDGDPQKALDHITAADLTTDSFARQIAIAAARGLEDDAQLARIIGVPVTIEELILKFDAEVRSGAMAAAAETLAKHARRLALPEAVRADMDARLRLNNWTGS